jgi:hypothetical protein
MRFLAMTDAGEELVAVPRALLGAACAAIRKKLDAPNTLAQLNRYAVDGPALAPSTSAATRGANLRQAAQNALTFYDGLNRDHEDGEARILDELQAALKASVEAALPHPAPAVESARVKVKPLEWVKEPVPPCGEWLARSQVGLYCIPLGHAGYPVRFRDREIVGEYHTLDEAKAAAEADYESRIRASLDLATDAEG